MKNRFAFYRFFPVILVAALFAMPTALNGQGSKANFSGDWVYNADNNSAGQAEGQQAGQRRGFGGGDFTAKQDANTLTVIRTRNAPDGSSTEMTTTYTLDGKESVNSSGRGESTSVAKWSADGKKLTITTTRTMTMNDEERTMVSTEVWSLTDSKTLKIDRTSPGRDGEERTTESVYTKK